jgi:hypothetical protein
VFGIPVWYACFPPDNRTLAYLFRNRDLIGSGITHDAVKQTIRAPLALGLPIEHSATPLGAALNLAPRATFLRAAQAAHSSDEQIRS